MFTRFSLRDYNFKLLITVIIAMICGVVMINSADSSFTPKQTIGIGLGVIIMIFVSLLNYDFVCRFYRVFFIINAVILLSVIFFGVEVNYAKRWIMIGGSGGIQFQPSEFSKILMILFTATFLDKLKEDNKINTLKGLCLFVLLIGLSLALIAVEPDLSTTLCLAMVLVTMLYLSGLSYKIIGIALLLSSGMPGEELVDSQIGNLFNHTSCRSGCIKFMMRHNPPISDTEILHQFLFCIMCDQCNVHIVHTPSLCNV